jgi:ABC-type multidrug transport system fused ATPase/permease subunit
MFGLELIVNFFKDNIKLFILYIVGIILLYPLESIVIPRLYGNMFSILADKNRSMQIIIRYFVYIVVAWILVQSAYILNSYTDSIITPRLNEYIRNYIFNNILLKYQTNLTELELGKISARIILIPSVLKDLFNEFTNSIFPKLFICTMITIYFFVIDYKIGFLTLFWIIVLYLAYKFNYNRCIVPSISSYQFFERISENVQDKLTNLIQIYANGKMHDEIKENENANEIFKNHYTKNLRCVTSTKAISYAINILIFVSINGFTLKLYYDKKIKSSQMIGIFITLLYFMNYLVDFSYYAPNFIYYFGILKETEEFLNDINKNTDDSDKKKIMIDRGEIELKNIIFSYDDNNVLFNNLNLVIPAEKRVAFVGSSGSGKSSLLKIIMGFYKPKSGGVYIDGQNIDECTMDSYRSKISYICQNTKLFNKTVYENITYGNNKSKEDIENIITKLKITDIFKQLKNGLDTNVGVNGAKLSGGQRQCIHIIRCLLTDNKIIIMDEPTSAIDVDHKKTIMNLIDTISKGKTLILITHDPSHLDFMDRVYKVDNGNVI